MYFETITQDFTIKRGADFSFTFDLDIDGVVIPLAGATVLCQVREQMDRNSPKMFDMTVTVSEDDEITIAISETQSAGATRRIGYYDVLIVLSNGDDIYPVEGQIVFAGSSTVKP